MSPPAKSIHRNYPAKALQPTFTWQGYPNFGRWNIYILDPALFLRYSQYKLAPTRQMRPPGGQGTHKAIQPRRHPGFLPPHRTIADLANFFPPSPMEF